MPVESEVLNRDRVSGGIAAFPSLVSHVTQTDDSTSDVSAVGSNKIVVFDGGNRFHGELMELKITRNGSFTLYGDPAIVNLN